MGAAGQHGDEEEGNRCDPHGREAGQEHGEDAEEAVPAGDGRYQLVVEAGRLDGAADPGQGPADGERIHEVCVVGDSEEIGAAGALAHGLQSEAESGPAQKGVHGHGADERHGHGQDGRRRAGDRDGRKPRLFSEDVGPARRGDALARPRTDDEVGGEAGGHEVEAEPAKDLVDVALGAQEAGQQGPKATADGPGENGQRNDEPRRAGNLPGDERGGDRAHDDLALDPDVPQPGGERHHETGGGQDERCPGQKGVGRLVGRAERALEDQLGGLEG